jgi:hypothetical protein
MKWQELSVKENRKQRLKTKKNNSGMNIFSGGGGLITTVWVSNKGNLLVLEMIYITLR